MILVSSIPLASSPFPAFEVSNWSWAYYNTFPPGHSNPSRWTRMINPRHTDQNFSAGMSAENVLFLLDLPSCKDAGVGSWPHSSSCWRKPEWIMKPSSTNRGKEAERALGAVSEPLDQDVRNCSFILYFSGIGEVKWSGSVVWLFATPWTVVYKAPLSMEFSMQEYWSGLPFPSPGDFPDPGIKPGSPILQADSLPSEPWGRR